MFRHDLTQVLDHTIMFSDGSPLLSIPVAIDAKQALFLDGMRHAAQIADHAYKRLCLALKENATCNANERSCDRFVPIFLDAWAFIDAVDRFRSLWVMKAHPAALPEEFSIESVQGGCKESEI